MSLSNKVRISTLYLYKKFDWITILQITQSAESCDNSISIETVNLKYFGKIHNTMISFNKTK